MIVFKQNEYINTLIVSVHQCNDQKKISLPVVTYNCNNSGCNGIREYVLNKIFEKMDEK